MLAARLRLAGASARRGLGAAGRASARPAFLRAALSGGGDRSVKVDANHLKAGMLVEKDGKALEVVSVSRTMQGRGSMNLVVELKDPRKGNKKFVRMAPSDKMERVYVEEEPFVYLYTDGKVLHLMHPDTMEQIELDAAVAADALPFMVEGETVSAEVSRGEIARVVPPPTFEGVVESTSASGSGSDGKGRSKKAEMENGLTVTVPSYIETGERIVFTTADLAFARRAS